MALRCEIALPRDFRPADVLAFHRRDPQPGAAHLWTLAAPA